MPWGEFAWKDVMERSETATRRKSNRRRAQFISGDPIPFLEAGDADWSWSVSRVVKTPLSRPQLQFTVTSFSYAGHEYGLDDLAQPVLSAVVSRANSVWVTAREGDEPGVRISEVAPPFPPKIDLVLESSYNATRDEITELTKEFEAGGALGGDGPVGAHLTLGPTDVGDFGFGGSTRLVLDALSGALGGRVGRPGDLRIRDLRVVRGPAHGGGTEIRLWTIE